MMQDKLASHDVKRTRLRRGAAHPSGLDRIDRTLLALLAERADRSYAELAQLVHLSPPAVHERVKRLRRDGVIRTTAARLDPDKIGCPLLAFAHVTTEGPCITDSILALRDRADVEEIHTAAGTACLILKLRCASPRALEALLSQIKQIEGVRATHSHIVLGTYLERGPAPELAGADLGAPEADAPMAARG